MLTHDAQIFPPLPSLTQPSSMILPVLQSCVAQCGVRATGAVVFGDASGSATTGPALSGDVTDSELGSCGLALERLHAPLMSVSAAHAAKILVQTVMCR